MMKKSFNLLVASLLATNISYAETWSSLEASEASSSNSAPIQPTPKRSASTKVAKQSSNSAPNTNALQLLFSEIETLRQEVQSLRDLVESQGYELKKLKTEQKERYIDLDRRMSQVLQNNGGVASDAQNDGVSLSGSESMGEKELYESALKLVREGKFQVAITTLQSFLEQYPTSVLAVNAYYWLGQVFYKEKNLDEARKAFTIVVNQYPNHQKAADSRYKLAVVLHQLGEDKKAKAMLEAVVGDYSQSSPGISRLAENYLNSNFK